jgi:hypothetical protein
MLIMNLRRSTNKNTAPWKVLAVVLVVAALGAGAFVLKDHSKNSDSKISEKPRAVNSVDYSGPTEEEVASGDKQKAENVERDNQPNTPPHTANVVVVDGSQYNDTVEVRAYISNIYEDGGECTATLTNNGPTITETSKAFKDATTTQCGTIDIPRSKFATAGDWQLLVTYSSASVTGTAAAKTVTIK